eukprot:NODE_27_length_39007_cov_1.590650.p20 type:complete len:252 gc:universal NODE_27_length_39007_cov_1.590650:790-1545(+)
MVKLKMDSKKPRALNFTVGKYLLSAMVALGVATFGLIISLPPIDVSFYSWYPQYKAGLSTFQASLFDAVAFQNIEAIKDVTLKPVEQKLQDDHKVDILLPKRWKSSNITSGSTVSVKVNQQTDLLSVKLKCSTLVLSYTIDSNRLAADGKNQLRTYQLSSLSVPCEFFTKYGLDNYIIVEQDPILVMGQLTGWNLDFFSMSGFPSWLRTLSLAFLTFPGMAISYCCSLCFYKKYRYRWKVLNGKLKHEAAI